MSPAGGAANLGNQVHKLRTALGLTQQQLGQRVGLTRQSIIAIEKGRFTPSVHTALLLASALDTTVDTLFWIVDDSKGEET